MATEYVRWDGQWVEVQTGGGGGELPQSVVHRWQFAASSGTVAADTIGSADGTVDGATWTSGSWVGSEALDFDGSNDSVEVASNRTEVGDTGTFAITAQFASFPTTPYLGIHDDSGSDKRLYIRSENDGEIRIGVADIAPLTGFTVSTGTPYRFVLTWDTGDATLYVNNTEEYTDTYTGTVSVTSLTEWFFGRTRSGVLDEDWFDGILDDAIVADDPYTTQQVQDDYDRQPWI
jgi:hypothetical protein